MFLKPFRIKTQTQLKGSEKKKLFFDVLERFPSISDEDLSKFLSNKSDVTLSKLYCNKGEMVHIYQIEKEPLFIKLDKDENYSMYPTVYLLWHFPHLLKIFTTQSSVIQRLQQGADLMLPGIEVEKPIGPTSYGKFDKGLLVAINSSDNACPVAIGKTALSSMDMYMSAGLGKGVIIIHVYGDHLWDMGSKGTRPQLEHPARDLVFSTNEVSNCNASDALSLNEDEAECCNELDTLELADGPSAVDELFLYCLLKACKTTIKKTDLPILTSNFYRLHMVPACPKNKHLDIKKSSYKKLSKFLNEMTKKGLLEVKEFPKGVENITEINYSNEIFMNFSFDDSNEAFNLPSEEASTNLTFSPPVLEELYQVSGTTIQFFKKNGLGKGDVLSRSEIRGIITNYIDQNNLKKGDKVEVDPLLHEAVVNPKEGYREMLKWDEIFSRFLGKMSPAFRISRPGEVPIIRKGKLELIEMTIAKRTGNKKVTLVYNVGVYGINENEFAHQIQIGVATSTSVGPAENKPQGMIQILVQGNQVAFISKLLLETYKIPRKYIKGLELAKKGRK